MTQCWHKIPTERPSMAKVVEIMSGLCEFFPGADTPINYDDCEQDDSECSEDEYMTYDTRDSLTDTHTTPHTLQDSQVSSQDQPARPYREIGQVRIPPQFTQEQGRSPITINRTSSSPVPEIPAINENSNLQDSLQVNSPHVFSESSSPRRLSPIGNYNIGNMNPRHIDIEQWNRQNDASPLRSPSVTSTINSKKEDYNQNYCDRLSATNSPMSPATEYNGNMSNLSQRVVDPRYQNPLKIEVDPNAWEFIDRNFDEYSGVKNMAGFDKYMYTVGNSSGSAAGESAGGGPPPSAPPLDPALDSMHMMLDPHLRPISPDLNNDESKRIFEEHKQLAQEYLKIQTELAYLSNHKSELEEKMDDDELRQKREIIQLENEKDSLVKLYISLKEQLKRVESESWLHPEEMPHE